MEWWKHLRSRKRDQQRLVRQDGKKQARAGIEECDMTCDTEPHVTQKDVL